jgi:hypothetical protein
MLRIGRTAAPSSIVRPTSLHHSPVPRYKTVCLQMPYPQNYMAKLLIDISNALAMETILLMYERIRDD